MSGLEHNNEPGEGAAGGSRALERHAEAVSSSLLDTRWLVGVAAVVPMFVAAGVYWLHHTPGGQRSQASGAVIEVLLVEQPAHSDNSARLIARSDPASSQGQIEPLIDAPNKPIPQETAEAASTEAMALPKDSIIEKPASLASVRPNRIPSGAAATFRRTLLSHIARYRKTHSAGLHGVVQVLFAMRRDGSVSEVWVRTSSGNIVLDQEAMDTIKRAQPLPGIPSELPDRLTVSLPVSFQDP